MEIFFAVVLLAIMEISLSLDNAIVNSSVLTKMSRKWQNRFLTWGILVAVLGMRLVLPVSIVSVAAHLPIMDVVNMALKDPSTYAAHLNDAHLQISSFGGAFLLLVFLNFLFDAEKTVHWIKPIESGFSKLAAFENITTAIALLVALFVPGIDINAALFGIIAYLALEGLLGACGEPENNAEKISDKKGFARFIYLEVLDASFSFDGVMGAFAISNNIFVIMVGLGIGAAVIRALTVKLVRGGTLKEFIYLEHGAHYGIGALAIIMLVSSVTHIPEIVTGLIGVSMIGLSLASSILHKKGQTHVARRA